LVSQYNRGSTSSTYLGDKDIVATVVPQHRSPAAAAVVAASVRHSAPGGMNLYLLKTVLQ